VEFKLPAGLAPGLEHYFMPVLIGGIFDELDEFGVGNVEVGVILDNECLLVDDIEEALLLLVEQTDRLVDVDDLSFLLKGIEWDDFEECERGDVVSEFDAEGFSGVITALVGA
jgi:hypothetical protein